MTSLYSHKTVLPTAVDVAVHCLQLYFVLAGSQLLNLNRANKKGSSSKLQILYYIMLLFSFGFGGGGEQVGQGAVLPLSICQPGLYLGPARFC